MTNEDLTTVPFRDERPARRPPVLAPSRPARGLAVGMALATILRLGIPIACLAF